MPDFRPPVNAVPFPQIRFDISLRHLGISAFFSHSSLGISHSCLLLRPIRLHDKLLLILSKHSVTSDWVEKEVETAFEKERKEKRTILFPIRLDHAVMQIETGWPADIRRTRHIGNFTAWKNHDSYQTAFNRLLRDLKSGK